MWVCVVMCKSLTCNVCCQQCILRNLECLTRLFLRSELARRILKMMDSCSLLDSDDQTRLNHHHEQVHEEEPSDVVEDLFLQP